MAILTKYVCDKCMKDNFKENELYQYTYNTIRIDLCISCVHKLINKFIGNELIKVQKYCTTCKGKGQIKDMDNSLPPGCGYDSWEYKYKKCPDCS